MKHLYSRFRFMVLIWMSLGACGYLNAEDEVLFSEKFEDASWEDKFERYIGDDRANDVKGEIELLSPGIKMTAPSGRSTVVRSNADLSFLDDGSKPVLYTIEAVKNIGTKVLFSHIYFRMKQAGVTSGYRVSRYHDGDAAFIEVDRMNRPFTYIFRSNFTTSKLAKNEFQQLDSLERKPLSVLVSNTTEGVEMTFYFDGQELTKFVDREEEKILSGYGVGAGYFNNEHREGTLGIEVYSVTAVKKNP